MSDPVITFAEARAALSLTPPPGAKARVLAAVLEPRPSRMRRPVRAPILAFALLVSASAAAVGGPPLVRLATRAFTFGKEPNGDSLRARGEKVGVSTTARPAARSTPNRAVPREAAPSAVVTPPDAAPSTALAPAPDRRTPNASGAAEGKRVEPPGDSSLAQEVALYREAAALVATSPGLAIVRLRAHRERFPRSALGEEVSLRLVQAFGALGRASDAQREAQSFVVRYPRSAKYAELRAIADGAPLRRPEE